MKINTSTTIMRNRCREYLTPDHWYSMSFITELLQLHGYKNSKLNREALFEQLSKAIDFEYDESKRSTPFYFKTVKEKKGFSPIYLKCVRRAIEDEQNLNGGYVNYASLIKAYLGDSLSSFFCHLDERWTEEFNRCLKSSIYNLISLNLREINAHSSTVKKVYLLKSVVTSKTKKASNEQTELIESKLGRYRSARRGFIDYADYQLAVQEIEKEIADSIFLGTYFKITFNPSFPHKEQYTPLVVRREIYNIWGREIEKKLKVIKQPAYREKCLEYFPQWKEEQLTHRLVTIETDKGNKKES